MTTSPGAACSSPIAYPARSPANLYRATHWEHVNGRRGARQWQKFGAPAMPTPGAILVFWRGSRDGWKGHVGFYAGEEADAYHVLGGNQGNSVSIARMRRDRLLEARWPATAPILDAGPVEIATGETMFSTNEA
ncbi:MAG: hypothetical protein HN650_08785 [Rhodospirillaceae bacterium]|nr:hypothetical protein [Rhodospirillaceae bacterium]